jgi:O-acetylhomoserine/O-acetylserine sulfhydrylase-like pyridoxal-dependent enzyme|tara:strand:- start:2837 stop:3016 length:180 start_codon:yes stop_codon:yes gene_type:complete
MTYIDIWINKINQDISTYTQAVDWFKKYGMSKTFFEKHLFNTHKLKYNTKTKGVFYEKI